MYYSAVSAKYVDGYRLKVSFEDGTTAVIDLAPYTRRGGVFRKLKDIEFFRRFKINTDFGVMLLGPAWRGGHRPRNAVYRDALTLPHSATPRSFPLVRELKF